MTTETTSPASADVLLVEDNPGDIRLVEEAFRDAGMDDDLHVVTDGTEALDFCYRREDHADAPRPDVILLDLNLPRMDGDEVLEELSADTALRRVPVVVLAGSEAQREIVRSKDLDADAYVTKPVEADEFLEIIRSFEEL